MPSWKITTHQPTAALRTSHQRDWKARCDWASLLPGLSDGLVCLELLRMSDLGTTQLAVALLRSALGGGWFHRHTVGTLLPSADNVSQGPEIAQT